jgi:hypothetical protein
MVKKTMYQKIVQLKLQGYPQTEIVQFSTIGVRSNHTELFDSDHVSFIGQYGLTCALSLYH